jgi:hypothetical protein
MRATLKRLPHHSSPLEGVSPSASNGIAITARQQQQQQQRIQQQQQQRVQQPQQKVERKAAQPKGPPANTSPSKEKKTENPKGNKGKP